MFAAGHSPSPVGALFSQRYEGVQGEARGARAIAAGNAGGSVCRLARSLPRSPTLWPPTPSSALSAPGSPPQHLADEAATPLALLGGLILWPLRLAQAPVSTLAGFRAWVLTECPVPPVAAPPGPRRRPAPHPRKAAKTARFLTLVTERHGLSPRFRCIASPGISAEVAPQVNLDAHAARTSLRKAVLSARTVLRSSSAPRRAAGPPRHQPAATADDTPPASAGCRRWPPRPGESHQ